MNMGWLLLLFAHAAAQVSLLSYEDRVILENGYVRVVANTKRPSVELYGCLAGDSDFVAVTASSGLVLETEISNLGILVQAMTTDSNPEDHKIVSSRKPVPRCHRLGQHLR